MKKFAFTLALALTCLLSAAQQPHKTLKERMKQGLSIEQIIESTQRRLNYSEKFDSIVSFYDGEKQVTSFTYDENANLSMILVSFYENDIMASAEKYVYAYDENNYCILDAEYEWNNEGWEEVEKYEYVFDANGNCLSEIYYLMESPQWKYLKTFDSDNNCLTEEYWYCYSSMDWMPQNRSEYTYDALGNLILCICKEGDYDGMWIDYTKNEYEYDSDNRMISDVRYGWNGYMQDWELQSRTTYSYDANNNLICKMIYYDNYTCKREYTYNDGNFLVLEVYTQLNENDDEWQNKSKAEYDYDQNDSLILILNYSGSGSHWHYSDKIEYTRNEAGYVTTETTANGYNDIWLYYDRYLYEYDNHNRLTCKTNLLWSNYENNFVNRSKELYEYDIHGNITKGIFYDFDDEWVLDESYENTYDLNADAANILGLSLLYNDFFTSVLPTEENPLQNKWLSCRINVEDEEEILLTMYYSNYCEVNENESTSLKAYSTEGTLSIENDNIADIQVFDMLGRLVAQQNQVAQCKFNLKPGVYVVKAGNASVKAVVK